MNLYEKDSYKTPVKCIFNHRIVEYDMKSANTSIAREFKLLPEDEIVRLENLPKKEREIAHGCVIRDTPGYGEKHKLGFVACRAMFFMQNEILDEEVVAIKRDAIFVMRYVDHEKVTPNINFRLKNVYSSYINLGKNIEIYYNNDKLDIKPDEIILGGKVKFWWKCEKGHEWQSSIPARIRNDKLYNRCPICSSYLRTSIPEKIIFYYVHKKFSKTIANYKPEWLKPKEIDIFIPELNVGIEYDGYYYHKDIKHDIEKDDLCSKNNVRIIRIREKKSKPINSSSIIYNIKIDNNTDYTYVEDALSFLNSYLNIDLDFDIRRDLDDIIKVIKSHIN